MSIVDKPLPLDIYFSDILVNTVCANLICFYSVKKQVSLKMNGEPTKISRKPQHTLCQYPSRYSSLHVSMISHSGSGSNWWFNWSAEILILTQNLNLQYQVRLTRLQQRTEIQPQTYNFLFTVPTAGRWLRPQRWTWTCVWACIRAACCVACWASGSGSTTCGPTMSPWLTWWRLVDYQGESGGPH